jgi:hypothetical protein
MNCHDGRVPGYKVHDDSLAGWEPQGDRVTFPWRKHMNCHDGTRYLGTRCMAAVLPDGSPRADRVTVPWRKHMNCHDGT